jgi:transposase
MPPEGGPHSNPERSHYRQPIGEDGAKRGMRGYDGGKQVKGRKRHIAVDTLGLLLVAFVHSAGLSDSRGVHLLLIRLQAVIKTIKLIWIDGGYQAGCIKWAKAMFGYVLEVVPKQGKGFQVLKKRWIVERSFAWLCIYRIHAKDYHHNPKSSEAAVYATNVRIMLRRLSQNP